MWCDEARVRDRVPAARLERAWVLRRRRSHAATAVRVELALAGPGAHPGIRVRALAGGCARIFFLQPANATSNIAIATNRVPFLLHIL